MCGILMPQNLCNFVALKSGSISLPTLGFGGFFFQNCFGNSESLNFHINFRISLLNYEKKSAGILLTL